MKKERKRDEEVEQLPEEKESFKITSTATCQNEVFIPR